MTPFDKFLLIVMLAFVLIGWLGFELVPAIVEAIRSRRKPPVDQAPPQILICVGCGHLPHWTGFCPRANCHCIVGNEPPA